MTDEGIWSAAVKRPLDVNSLGVAGIDGVDEEDMPTIRALCKVWRDRYPYNLIRSSYYFARYQFKDFDISIPDRICPNVSACVGWPAKAVRALADLSVFDGWDLGGVDPYGVRGLADETSLELAIPQTIVSAYMHGCAFLTITKDAEGVIVTPNSVPPSGRPAQPARRRIDHQRRDQQGPYHRVQRVLSQHAVANPTWRHCPPR